MYRHAGPFGALVLVSIVSGSASAATAAVPDQPNPLIPLLAAALSATALWLLAIGGPLRTAAIAGMLITAVVAGLVAVDRVQLAAIIVSMYLCGTGSAIAYRGTKKLWKTWQRHAKRGP